MAGSASALPALTGTAGLPLASSSGASPSAVVNAGASKLQQNAVAFANALQLGQPAAFASAQAMSQSAANGDWISRQLLDAVKAILWRDKAAQFVRSAVEWRSNGAGVVGPLLAAPMGSSSAASGPRLPAPTAQAAQASAAMSSTPPAASPSGYMPSAASAIQTALSNPSTLSTAQGITSGAQSALGGLGGVFGDPFTPPADPQIHPRVRASIASCVRAANLGDQVSMAQLAQLRKAALAGRDPAARRQFHYALSLAKTSVPQPAFGVAFGAAFGKEKAHASSHPAAKHASAHSPAPAHKAAAKAHATAAKHASVAASKRPAGSSAGKAAVAHQAAAAHHAEAAKHAEAARAAATHREAAARHAEAVKHEVMAKRASHEAAAHAVASRLERQQKGARAHDQQLARERQRDALRKRANDRHPAFRNSGGGGGNGGGGGGGGGSSNGGAYDDSGSYDSGSGGGGGGGGTSGGSGGGSQGQGRAEHPLRKLVRAAAAGNTGALRRIHSVKVAAHQGDTRAQSLLTAMQQIAREQGSPQALADAGTVALSHGRPLTTSRVHGIASEFGAEAGYVVAGAARPRARVPGNAPRAVQHAIRVGQEVGIAQELQAQRFPNGPVPAVLVDELY